MCWQAAESQCTVKRELFKQCLMDLIPTSCPFRITTQFQRQCKLIRNSQEEFDKVKTSIRLELVADKSLSRGQKGERHISFVSVSIYPATCSLAMARHEKCSLPRAVLARLSSAVWFPRSLCQGLGGLGAVLVPCRENSNWGLQDVKVSLREAKLVSGCVSFLSSLGALMANFRCIGLTFTSSCSCSLYLAVSVENKEQPLTPQLPLLLRKLPPRDDVLLLSLGLLLCQKYHGCGTKS